MTILIILISVMKKQKMKKREEKKKMKEIAVGMPLVPKEGQNQSARCRQRNGPVNSFRDTTMGPGQVPCHHYSAW